ncbi:hypothetical protein C0992_006637 [Termitomyces sp. T32_za158]|nr:hypothetical protein C0992_006637 [Termitomyces sp. T32_za158]
MDQTPSTFNSKTIAEFNEVTWHYETVRSALEQIMLTLSDSIVIWRAWALVQRIWVMAFPVLLVFASTACGFARLAILASDFRWFIAFTNLRLSLGDVLLTASLALSFLANTFATLSILHTLWLHLRSRKELGLHDKPSKVLKVLAIIVDTGLAFLLLQGLNIIFSFLPFDHYSSYDFFQTVIFSGYSILTGMYPTIVVYLVNQQRSLVEVFVLSDANGKVTPELPFDRTVAISALVFASSETTAEAATLDSTARL